MASVSSQLTGAAKAAWKPIASVCEDAAVFLDRGAAEHLHWVDGMGLLGRCVGAYDLDEELGPVARNFIAMAPYCHVVIVVTTFLHGVCSEAISRVLTSLNPLECHVFCAVSEELHAKWIPMPPAVPPEGGAVEGEREEEEGKYSHYGEFQALIKKWINRESGVRVSVSAVSLFQCGVVPGLYVTPSFSSLCPLLPSDTVHIQAKLIQEGDIDTALDHLGQVEFSMLSHELQTKLRCFAYAVSDLLGEMNTAEDIFSLGLTSRLLGHQLAGMPQARTRRKNAAGRCSILLVDRTLDVAGPTFLSLQDSLADRLLSSLPHLPTHTSDIAVSPTITTSVPGSATIHTLMAGIGGQEGDSIISQLTLIASRELEVEREKPPHGEPWEREGGEGDETHSGKKEGVRSLAELLSLAVCMYSLVGDECGLVAEEKKFRVSSGVALPMCFLGGGLKISEGNEVLSDLVAVRRGCDAVFTATLGITDSASKREILGRVNTVLETVQGLGTARDQLRQFSSVLSEVGPPSYQPLLTQVVDAIFSPDRPDLPDIQHHSHGFTDILKSGLSLFMSSARPRPNNHPLLLIIVVGGVTCSEVRSIRDTVAGHHSDTQVLILSTRLLHPTDITTLLLASDRTKT